MQVNVAGIRRNIKNLAHNYSDAQKKVREATSNDPWGPSATIMAEVADLTYNVVAFSEIMQMIWKRLNDHGKNWRHVYKALILLEYLIKTGNEKVAQQCKENIFAIQTLKEFVHVDENKDQGLHVREKAKQLVSLLKDDERLRNERTKALKAKERFAQHASGFGSDGSIDGPTHRDSPSWRSELHSDPRPSTGSELEFVRPQTVGEEELQLQLAMAMSREEAEQEEQKRRSDDVRLQLAISQSEQDFKTTTVKHHHKQSHLMDLLDIPIGAMSISDNSSSSDPWMSGAAAGGSIDPWAQPQPLSSDPWNPMKPQSNAALSNPMDNWLTRTDSPSVTSGSSTDDSRNMPKPAAINMDPWNGKSSAPPPDPWNSNTNSNLLDNSSKATLVDPWAPVPASMGSRPSPIGAQTSPNSDLDEFDIITNRSKSMQSPSNGTNNNNHSISLLDDLDPLSSNNSHPPKRTPQSFLGENSALVNLDNLIKPVSTNNQPKSAFNPFGDVPKQNLFQQQAQPVPSMNQLKQTPFSVSLNQDPWAPVNTNNANAQNNNTWMKTEGAASNPFL